jgi:hypothetical protein
MNKDKVRTMIRSILPSTWCGAAQAKALRKRAVRHGVRIDIRCENAEETPVDLCRDAYMRDIVRDRRGADKLEHFMRWCEALTKGMSHAEKLSTIKALLPNSLIGEHAYEHWKGYCDPRWSGRQSYTTYEQRLQSIRDSLRFRLHRALAEDPTLLGRLNAAIKKSKVDDEPRRMLFGVHDIDDYVIAVTSELYWDQQRITIQLIEAIEGGREAALDRLMRVAGGWVSRLLGCLGSPSPGASRHPLPEGEGWHLLGLIA